MPIEKHVVALSGGKDSTAMALELNNRFPEIEFEYVCTPTGDELPEMESHFLLLERLLNKPLIRLPNKSLDELIDEWNMLPNHRARWCTRVIKIEPFINYMETLPIGSVLYVGLRADETGRLGLVAPDSDFVVSCPMQTWGWAEEDVMRYLNCQGITIPKRTDCARCFWQTLPQWHNLYKDNRHIYVHALLQELRTGHTFRSPQRDTWPASLLGLAKEFDNGRAPKPRKKIKKNPDKCRFCTM